jgi:nucleoside-diphosphate-sugar epimerase
LALDHYYDISRAKKELGYTPAYTMAQAMEKTVAYLLDTRDSWAA